MKKILTINPGSTSTKIAIFENENNIFEEVIRHSASELSEYLNVSDQFNFRKSLILDVVKKNKFDLKELDCIVGRGGLLKPIEGGTYEVNDAMINDLKNAKLEHASNLGGLISKEIADELNIKAFIVDPVVVDELHDVARVSGHKCFERKSIFHALNQKAVAKKYAINNNRNYEDLNLIVVHLGGGISVGAHQLGRVIDVNNALDGEGPFSPERSGTLPIGDIYKMAFSGKKTLQQMKKMNVGDGGVVSYLGISDMREVQTKIESGDKYSKLIKDAMIYQVAKEIGSIAVVLKGKIDSIIITGGIAYDKIFIEQLKSYISFLGNVTIYPGEDEMYSLALGGLNVLNELEVVKKYK